MERLPSPFTFNLAQDVIGTTWEDHLCRVCDPTECLPLQQALIKEIGDLHLLGVSVCNQDRERCSSMKACSLVFDRSNKRRNSSIQLVVGNGRFQDVIRVTRSSSDFTEYYTPFSQISQTPYKASVDTGPLMGSGKAIVYHFIQTKEKRDVLFNSSDVETRLNTEQLLEVVARIRSLGVVERSFEEYDAPDAALDRLNRMLNRDFRLEVWEEYFGGPIPKAPVIKDPKRLMMCAAQVLNRAIV